MQGSCFQLSVEYVPRLPVDGRDRLGPAGSVRCRTDHTGRHDLAVAHQFEPSFAIARSHHEFGGAMVVGGQWTQPGQVMDPDPLVHAEADRGLHRQLDRCYAG